MIRSAAKLSLLVCLTALLAANLWATDPPASPETPTPPTAADIAKLKAKLEEQQKEVEKLQAELAAQLKMLEQASAANAAAPAPVGTPSAPAPQNKPYVGGLTASTTPIIQPEPAPLTTNPFPGSTPAPRIPLTLDSPSPQAPEPPAPLHVNIGESTITPIGFMDMTAVFRSAATNYGIGTNFGSLPFNNSFPLARLTETRLNPQNSRVGARFDTTVHDAR